MTSPAIPLSILDLAPIPRGGTAGESFAASVALAQLAERLGYERVWYAEHHNLPSIASSATSVLIAHVAAHTASIRLGAGGIMLPNHSPLMVAEQFGTLAALHPGRIDLGLGRAPGSDQITQRALRRSPQAADEFPQDVLELQGYFAGRSRLPGVQAIPGKGADVPLYILGSSLFGAQLAAALGLPYAFASHFAPQALMPALEVYRRDFRPSEQLEQPYVIVGANVVAADTVEDAQQQVDVTRRLRAVTLFGQGREYSDELADALLQAGASAQIDAMLTYTAVGTRDDVRAFLTAFADQTGADEIITAHHSPTTAQRLHSVTLLAEAMTLVPIA